jgi:oligopeptide/dipeptide ABC transporter ATP-binding protein
MCEHPRLSSIAVSLEEEGPVPEIATRPPLRTVWTAADPILEVRNLKTWHPIRAGGLQRIVGHVRAVDGVDLSVRQGETLGLVGESGAGKSTLARSILRLVEPTAGEVIFKGSDLLTLSAAALRPLRRELAIVFQDPFASLDPRQTVGEIVAEPLDIHGLCATKRDRQERVQDLLRLVSLSPGLANRYPRELGAGLRQRVGMARALAPDPSLLICDEPVSALDVSIQTQTVDLLKRLQERFKLTLLFTANDLALARRVSDRIAVMHMGRVVEVAAASELLRRPRHPHTASLLSAIAGRPGRGQVPLAERPSPATSAAGCRYRTRCFNARDRCAEEEPPLDTVQIDDHEAACFYPL